MLSKNKIKYIRSLELKKNRKEEHAFLAEGNKLVNDLINHFSCQLLVATKEWLQSHPHLQAAEIIEVTHEELSRASLLKTPQEVLAVFEQPHYEFDANVTEQSLCLALDDVQDPGNLGTIIRIADWFGIEHIFCSSGTADVYNPKTIQATMGAIARVKLHYCNLPDFLKSASQKNTPIFGTFLDVENIYTQELPANGIIIMGNEGNGISKQIAEMVTHRILIPNYPQGCETSESLNVAVATAIVCAEFRRRTAWSSSF